ncbi:MAG: hypothetical protein Hyperionvirus32_4 [Hyperionvirus sp.]|uniref:Uncharacterized protein n=1 Tax=Hyperionvirus sp. TaxID=2487770 RepID=A0A3G5ABV2_9VIRU|nr:MAG: hypothetical protein Hyperionvirus32_4 [Hyperionvirus sp.]
MGNKKKSRKAKKLANVLSSLGVQITRIEPMHTENKYDQNTKINHIKLFEELEQKLTEIIPTEGKYNTAIIKFDSIISKGDLDVTNSHGKIIYRTMRKRDFFERFADGLDFCGYCDISIITFHENTAPNTLPLKKLYAFKICENGINKSTHYPEIVCKCGDPACMLASNNNLEYC